MFVNRLTQLKQKLEVHNIEAFITYKQENREYLTNFTGSSGYLVVSADQTVLFTDSRYMEQARMETKNIGIEVVEHETNYHKTLSEYLNKQNIKTIGFESSNVTVANYELWKNHWDIDVKPLPDLIAELRMIKDVQEIAILQQAVDLTDQAFSHLMGVIAPGMRESEIALILEIYLKKNGASGIAFNTIVASGKRSALPHGIASSKKIEPGDFVTIDFGARYKGYCSDMTRTFTVGKASQKQKEIYNTVLTAQQLVLDNIKAGMTGKQADDIARDYIYKRGYRGYFGHGLGHALGKEVHEAPRLNPISEVTLQPGMVVTVEPGIYIPDYGGVRIEDDIVIEENGCRILNKTPKDLLEI